MSYLDNMNDLIARYERLQQQFIVILRDPNHLNSASKEYKKLNLEMRQLENLIFRYKGIVWTVDQELNHEN